MSETLANQIRARAARFTLGRTRRLIDRFRGGTGRTPEFLFDAPFVKIEPEKVAGCEVVGDRYEMLKKFPKGGVVCEVGTQRGLFARRILDACAPDKLYVVDISYELFVDAPLQAELDSGKLIKVQGWSHEALAEFDDGVFDWIYVDAGHGYEDVKRDLDMAVRKVKPDGFIVANDYCLWSPIEMVPYGVMAAVNDLCNRTDWKLRYFALNHLSYYDVVLTRGNSALDRRRQA